MIKRIIMVFSVLLIIFFSYIIVLRVSTKQTYDSDNTYISSLLKKELKVGMPLKDVKSFFLRNGQTLKPWRGSKSDIYRECKNSGKAEKDCEEFERIITGLPLPSNNIWLGKGDAQIYIIIDKNKRLESFFFEIYYPRFH